MKHSHASRVATPCCCCSAPAEKGATSYAAVAQQLRQLQMVLQRLEAEVASLKVDPEKGLTRPGAFIFELLGK